MPTRDFPAPIPVAGGRVASDRDQTGVRFGPFLLDSHFQPIYSIPHGRLVGHEALLRASTSAGQPVSPVEVFSACEDEQQLCDCDRLSRLVHLESWSQRSRQRGPPVVPEWLFLNVHPMAFQLLGQEGGAAQWRELQRHYALSEGTLVLEVLEAEAADPAMLAASIGLARDAGLLIAIDDFGAGHSNFDRVWRMRPDIVKIDRTLVARAACDASAARIMAQMVSLLHECGAIVLVEGVETHAEAMVAIDCDAELVQGYLFGRPDSDLRAPWHSPDPLRSLPRELAAWRERRQCHQDDRARPFREAMQSLAAALVGKDVTGWQDAGDSTEACRFAQAAQAFLGIEGAQSCWLLDEQGRQLGRRTQAAAPVGAGHPMDDADGVCWLQRPYFNQALEKPGQVQASRPHRQLLGRQLCVTVAIAVPVRVDGHPGWRVACGDFAWSE
ncbi:MAG: EAL domain-containing protein [Pseudomonadota bacterium]|nr:EAL domain-containing protein [Pseudomonadota bacterium]